MRIKKQIKTILKWLVPWKNVIVLIVSVASLVLSVINSRTAMLSLPFDLAWVAILLCGIPILKEAVTGLVTRLDIKADVLVAIALIAAVCVREDFAAGEVAFIMQLGSFLEETTVKRTRAGIEKLVALKPQKANRLTENGEESVAVEEIGIGDHLRVKPGEAIPVDGVIVAGETTLNQSVITGESRPVEKKAGDDVASGAVNQYGVIEMRATKIGEDSSLQRMIRLVEAADADKTETVRIADRMATWIVCIALFAAVLAYVVSGVLVRAVTVLVVFCPCSLVLATPTAIMAAIGNAARHGFLVKEGAAMERLAKISQVAFDKTGTLTTGNQTVMDVVTAEGYSREELFTLCASAESMSEHPVGKAIVRSYAGTLLPCENFVLYPGRGISATVDSRAVLAGNEKFLTENGIRPLAKTTEEDTVVQVAIDGKAAGYIVLSDTVRPESKNVIRDLRRLGIQSTLLTGDKREIAEKMGKELGIANIYAECLPAAKLSWIADAEQKGGGILMIGDGINDAPALKRASVSIAMGGIGSDIAVDAADLVLVEDELSELPHLLTLSRRMMRTIKVNIVFSMILNFVSIALAIAGILTPVLGALVHNAGSVLVIVNSAFLLGWKAKS